MTSSTLQCKGNPAWKCKQRCLEANNRQENVEGQGNQNRFCLVEWVAEITECMVCSPSNRIIHWKQRQARQAECRLCVFGSVFVASMHTGMRCGELFALRVEDLKLDTA